MGIYVECNPVPYLSLVQFSSCFFLGLYDGQGFPFFLQRGKFHPLHSLKQNIFPESRPSQKEHFIFQLIFRVNLLVAGRVHPWRLRSNIIPWRFGSDHFPFFSWVICRFHPPSSIFQGLSIFQQCFHIENKVISLEFWSCKFHRNLVTFHVSESYDSLGRHLNTTTLDFRKLIGFPLIKQWRYIIYIYFTIIYPLLKGFGNNIPDFEFHLKLLDRNYTPEN